MSFKRSISDDISEMTKPKEGKFMPTPHVASRSKESASSVASESKQVTAQSPQTKRKSTSLAAPKPPTPTTKQALKASETEQTRRNSASVKMPDRSSSNRADKTLSSIVKGKHKKDNGLPVAWRKELYSTRPGSAQARLENLRAALQKEVEEQKVSKAAWRIPIKRSDDQKSLPIEKATSAPSTSQSSSTPVTTVAATSAVPEVATVKHADTVPEVSNVKQAGTVPVSIVIEKHTNSSEMDMECIETDSPKPAFSFSPAVQTTSSFTRYNAPAKIPNRNVSTRPDKTLSSIVKVKHKKDNGLPVAWRKELYGTRPGSAQARLEGLRAALQKEVEEQKVPKATTSIPKASPKENVALPPSTSQSSTTLVTATSAVPEVATVKHSCVPEVPIVKQTSTAPNTPTTRAEKLEDSYEMDVDEENSPEPADSFPPAVQASWKSMEYDSFVESMIPDQKADHSTKFSQEVKQDTVKDNTKEEANDDSQKVASDLKTRYKDGLSAFASYFYCIIDTNIFIEYYNDFQGFLSRKYSGSQPIVVVPYKVLHELDIVKHKKPQLGSKITPVVKFLHQMLRTKDARVKGQHPWDDTIELMPVLSPDDSIINCALQVQSVAASGNVKVVLVSNDCNMLTKALVANLNSCTMEELHADYKF